MTTLEKKISVGADEILAAARSLLAAGKPELATLSVLHSYALASRMKGRAALAAECVRAVPGSALRATCRLAFVCGSIDGFGIALVVSGLAGLVDVIEGFSTSESAISHVLGVSSLAILFIAIAADVVAVLWLGRRIRAKDAALGEGIPRLTVHLVLGAVAVIVQWVDVYLGLGGENRSFASVQSTLLLISTLCACGLTNSRADLYAFVGLVVSIPCYGAMLIGSSAPKDLADIALFVVLVVVWFTAGRTFSHLPIIEAVRAGSIASEGSGRP